MKKKALITGINGMDGSHLADFLLSKNYEVWGMERNASSGRKNTKHLKNKIHFINGNLCDTDSLVACLKQSNPDEVYNLGSNSGAVGASWKVPEITSNIDGLGVLRVLEATRKYNEKIKVYQASSSEIFGRVSDNFANENTPFYPKNPYGVSKLYGHWMTKNYRESYDMFACSGILFNHESERRDHNFVTRKISDGVAKIYLGLENYITLGNLKTKRDWGYAPDYVEAMWLMLQKDTPDDYVIATGELHSLEDFLDIAFKHIGINIWSDFVKQDKKFMRPLETDPIRGNSSKAQKELNWKPSINFKSLVTKMVDHDIKMLKNKKGVR